MKKLLSLSFIAFVFIFICTNKVQANDETEKGMPTEVDVVLFWGQSNMVGTAGRYDNEDEKDTRDLSGFIDEEILQQYKQMDYVSVQIPNNVAYEYKIDELGRGYLSEITENTRYCGENLTYKNGILYSYNENTSFYYDFKSLYQSYGTNMIPQFCKSYYTKTGRCIVAVMAAKGGEQIGNFLPSNDPNYTDTQYKYLYESMIYKYTNALQHLSNRGIKVKNKFYVVCQGENDATKQLSDSYYKTFLNVHKNLKNDLGLQFGIINTTGRNIKYYDADYTYVKKINDAQKKLANKNNDIIIGSNLGFEVYKNRIREAFCLENSRNYNENTTHSNLIHFNSATLSQLGKDSANAAVKYLRNVNVDQAPHFQVSVNNNKIYYNIRDGKKIKKYSIKQLPGGNVVLHNNVSSSDIKEISKKTNLLKLNLDQNKKYVATAYDSEGNIIKSQFLLKRNKNGNYTVQNAPELYSVFTEGNKINLYFTASSSIAIKNLEQKSLTEKAITKVKNKSGKDYCKVSISLKEMTYKDGAYYAYVRAYDTTSNKLYSYQRIKITKK